jgi:UDP-glucose 4-epimerase
VTPQRILLTGGAGFIGSHVAEAYLRAGHAVLVVDNLSCGSGADVPRGAGFAEIDIRERDALRAAVEEFRPTVVNHHAAQKSVAESVRSPSEDARVNVVGLLNVLEAAAAVGARRFIFASTGGALYGGEAPLPTPEDAAVVPDSPYGVSKFCGEQYVGLFRRLYGLSPVVLRYGNVYGPRQDPHGEAGVVAIFCRAVLAGEPCRVFGDGEQTRDFVHVADVARANLLALDGPGGTYNVATGVETSVNAIVEMLRRAAGRPVAVEHAPARPGEVRRSLLDPRRARERLGWRAQVDVSQGIAQTFEWFRRREA